MRRRTSSASEARFGAASVSPIARHLVLTEGRKAKEAAERTGNARTDSRSRCSTGAILPISDGEVDLWSSPQSLSFSCRRYGFEQLFGRFIAITALLQPAKHAEDEQAKCAI